MKTIQSLLQQFKYLLVQKFERVLDADLADHFSHLVTALEWQYNNLNSAQFSFFSSAKLLSDLISFELPTIKDLKEEGDRKTLLYDSIQSKLDSYSQSSNEVRARLAIYCKDQAEVVKDIASYEQQLTRCRDLNRELTEKIKSKTE
ncbi:hypothetical protein A2U01_0012360, partial [Trifolium medium]|nr:hypothetical protein [Trifolium medium]